jgi:transcriptional regulator with XRE-family HTH domain
MPKTITSRTERMTRNDKSSSPLKVYRESHGWTRAEIASRLNADYTRVRDYENGKTWPRPESIASVADAFYCTPEEFLILMYKTMKWSEQGK